MSAQEHDRKLFLEPTVNAISTMLELPVSIWLVDEKANVLRATAVTEPLEKAIGNKEVSLDGPSVAVEVFKTREAAIVHDIESDKNWQFKNEIIGLGLRSAVMPPLLLKNRKVGVLVVYIPENKPLNLEELKPKVESSASQIAATLRHIEGLETLNEVGQLINSEIQSPDIFKNILESSQKVLNCEHVSIFLVDNISGDLELRESSSSDVKRKRFKSGEGLVSAVVRSGKSLLVSDIREHPGFVKGLTSDIEERSMLLSPIKTGDQIIGAISADFHGLDGFDNHDQILLEALTKQTATAIQNNDLFQRERDKAQALAELYEITRNLLSVEELPEIRDILTNIAEKSKEVLKADLIELYEYKQDQNKYVLPHIIAGERFVQAIPKEIYDEDAVFSLIDREKPFYMKDAQAKVDFTKPYLSLREDQPKERYIIREKIRSAAVIPLRTDNESMGLMFANYRSSQEFAKEQQELIDLFANQAAIAIKNARLYYDVNIRRKALVEVGKKLTAEIRLSEEDVLELIYEQASEKLGMKNLSIALYDEETDTVRFALAYSEGSRINVEGEQGWESRTGGNGKTEKVIHNKRYLLLNTRKEVEQAGFLPKKVANSWLGVPMIFAGRVLGVIANYEYGQDYLYDEDDIEILQALADMAAIAIENARLYVQRADDISALQEINEAVVSKTRDEILQMIVGKTVETMPGEHSSLWLIEHETGDLVLEAVQGPAEAKVREIKRLKKAGDTSINMLVAETGKLYKCDNVESEPRFYRIYEKTKSSLTVPLRYQDRVIGTLNVESSKPEVFTEQHGQLLDSFSDQAAIAIENFRLYEQLQKQKEDQIEAIRQISTSIASPYEINRILEGILDWTITLMGKANLGEIRMLDKETNELVAMASRGESINEAYRRVPVGKGITGWAARNRLPELVQDVSKDSRYLPFLEITGSEIAVPILKGWEVIGVLNIEHPKINAFTENDVKLAESVANMASIAIENSRLYEKVQKQRETQIRAFGEISSSIAAPFELDRVLDGILDWTILLMGEAVLSDILLLDDEADELEAVKSRGETARKKDLRIPLGKGITGWVARNRKTLYVPDVLKDERYISVLESTRSEIAVPLLKDEKLIGILNIEHQRADAFTDDDVKLAVAIGNLAAIAIENAKLYDDLHNLNDQLEKQREIQIRAIGEISASITATLELDQILDSILDWTRLLMGEASLGSVLLFDKKKNELTARHYQYYIEKIKEKDLGILRIPVGKGITGWVAKSKEPLYVRDVSKDERYLALLEGMGSEIAVPMLKEDELIGVLNIEHHKVNAFTEQDVKLAVAIANLAAIAIENARLYEQLKKQREVQVRAISEISTSIIDPLELDQVLDGILNWAIFLMGEASVGEIRLLKPDSGELVAIKVKGEDTREEFLRLPMTKGITGWAAVNKTPVYAPDVSEDDRYLPFRNETKSEIAVPMLKKDRLIGVLNIEHPESDAFTEEDVRLAVAIGNLAAIAIEDTRLYEKLREQREAQIKAVREISTSVVSSLELKPVLDSILDCTISLMGKESRGEVLLTDRKTNKLVTERYRGEAKKQYHTLAVGEGITGWVAQNRKPVHAPDVSKDSRYLPCMEGIKSEIAVPMMKKDELIGVLNLEHPQVNAFSEHDFNLAVAIGNLAAVAIENARLHEKIQESRDKLDSRVKERTAELRKEHNQLQTLINNLPAYIFIKDTEGRFIISNEAHIKILGATKQEELTGKTDFDFFTREMASQYYADEQELIRSGQPLINKDEDIINLKGKKEWLLTSKVPLRDQDGNITGLVGISRDITERKRAQKIQVSLYEISEAAHNAQNLENLYPLIHNIISELMPAKNFYLVIEDSVSHKFTIPYCEDQKGECHDPDKLMEKALAGYVFKTGKPLISSPEIRNNLSREGKIKLIGKASKSWLGVPLGGSDKCIGVMVVQSYDEELTYGNEEKEILGFVSKQVAMAIERVRSQEKLEEHRNHLEKIVKELEERTLQLKGAYKISEAAHTARSLKELYPGIHETVNELMSAKNFFIVLYDSTMEKFTLEYFRDEYDDTLPVDEIIKKGLTGYVFQTKQPLISSPEIRANFIKQDKIKETVGTPSKSWLGVPLKAHDSCIGVIVVQSYNEEFRYGELEKNILMFVSAQIATAIERVRTEEELEKYHNYLEELVERRTARLNALYKISEAAHNVKNLRELYPEIHKAIDELMDARNFYITLYDSNADTLRLVYSTDEKAKKIPVDKILKKGLTGYVLRIQKPLLASPEVFEKLVDQGEVGRIETQPGDWLGVPLTADGNIIGVLAVQSYSEEISYGEAEKDILVFVSEQIAMAIMRVQTEDELREYRENLEKLVLKRTSQLDAAYKISEAAHSAKSLGDFYKSVHEIIRGLMPAENFRIVTFNAEGIISGFPYFVDQKDKEPSLQREIIEKGKPGYIFKTGEPLLIKDRQDNENRLKGKIDMLGTRAESWLDVPLKIQDRTVGVLTVYDYGKSLYGEPEKEILMFVSNQIAMSIERVQANKGLIQRTAQLNAAYRISEATHKAQNLNELYAEIHKIVGELMPVENFYISPYNPSGDTLSFPYFINNKGELPLDPMPIKQGFSGYVMQTQKPLFGSPEVIKKLIEDGKIIPVAKRPVSFFLGVPLKTKKRIGVLAVYDHDGKVIYSRDDLDILVFVSEQIAMAIERVETEEKLKKHRDHLEKLVKERTERLENLNHRKEVLIDLGQKLTSSIQFKQDDILQLIYKNASELMDTNNMYIGFYDESIDFVHFPLAFKNGKPTNIPSRTSGGGRTEEIIRTQKPIYIKTRKESEEWYFNEQEKTGRVEYMDDPLASWIGVPMMVGEKVLGVVATYHPKKDYVYSEDDLEILQAMASLAAIALDNARLVSELILAQNEIADRERELIISGLAMDFIHKMNNIAGTIPHWVNLIRRKASKEIDPKIIQYLDRIERETLFILKEANELKKPLAKPELTDMEELTGSVITQLEMMTPHDIIFNFIRDTELFCVYGINEYLSVAIHSVMMNSVKAISGQGEITIHLKNLTKGTEKCIEINISDTGCGIPQDKIDSVFEYGTSLWQDRQGTGYGLWRARSIIQSMNGSIKVDHSEVGKGTTFIISLPAVENKDKISEVTDE